MNYFLRFKKLTVCLTVILTISTIPQNPCMAFEVWGSRSFSDTTKRDHSINDYSWESLWKNGVVRATTKAVPLTDKLLEIIPDVVKPSLATITKGSNSEFKLMAIGGSLASGVRDGGVFRESQLTAYPNLIAKQMGINFKQPLFSFSEANGSGYKILLKQSGPVYQYEEVTNNLGYNPLSADKQFTKSVGDYDNLAMPFFNVRYPWKTMEHYDRPVSEVDEESTDFVRYFKRIMTDQEYFNPNLTYLNFLKTKTLPDFIIYDLGMDGYLKEAMIGGYVSQLPFISEGERGARVEFLYLKQVVSAGGKGIVVNIPDVMDLPYFKMYSLDKLKEFAPNVRVAVEKNNGKIREANSQDIFLPSDAITGLFTNPKDIVLKETEVIAIDEDLDEAEPFRSVAWYNEYYVKYTAEENKLPVLDLYSLYKQIINGNYVTADGVKVNPSFPNGNFFSSDGIHPSAFGQAVIANECIKAINKFYRTEIKYIPTAKFITY